MDYPTIISPSALIPKGPLRWRGKENVACLEIHVSLEASPNAL
jgi:hypothetical protein